LQAPGRLWKPELPGGVRLQRLREHAHDRSRGGERRGVRPMAELTNMIVGNVKTELECKLGPLGLSIPTVVYGRKVKTKTAGTTDWI
jgi:hypothetical protein